MRLGLNGSNHGSAVRRSMPMRKSASLALGPTKIATAGPPGLMTVGTAYPHPTTFGAISPCTWSAFDQVQGG
jgi:hypothetical protein